MKNTILNSFSSNIKSSISNVPPLEIPSKGLRAYYDAHRQSLDFDEDGDRYVDDDSLNTIIDYSGNSKHSTQPTVADQPSLETDGVNNKPGFYFDGSDYVNISPRTIPAGNNSYDVFILALSTVDNRAGCFSLNVPFSGDGVAKKVIGIRRNDTTDSWYHSHWANDTSTSSNNFPINTPVLSNFVFDVGNNLKVYINNELDTTNTNITERLSNSIADDKDGRLGKTHNNEYLTGYIAFWALYDRILSSPERTEVYKYCKKVGWL